jgi:hypothetical protein
LMALSRTGRAELNIARFHGIYIMMGLLAFPAGRSGVIPRDSLLSHAMPA